MFGWNFLFVIVVGPVLSRVLLIPADRQRRWRAGKPVSEPWTGNCASCVVVDLPIEPDRVEAVALRALQRVGVTPEARPAPPWWWVGFTGWEWRSATWGFEFAIGAADAGPGRVQFWCCSRPRFSIGLFDFGASGRRARRLANALRHAATLPPD